MSSLELKLKPEGWGKENQLAESIDTDALDGHEFGYRYVGNTDYSEGKSMLALLPKKEPRSTEVFNVGEVVLQLAEQIPYHHQSQIKLARIMEELTRSPNSPRGRLKKNVLYMRGQRFKESLRDWYNGPGEDEPQTWRNLNAFFAHEASTHIRPHHPDFAIWTLRDAFEKPAEPMHWSTSFKRMRDQQIIAAAQYILWDGQELFKHVPYPDSIEDTKDWEPGLLYFGASALSLKRWRFWKDGFRKAAGADSDMSDECRKVSAKAATWMEALEASMIF